MTDIDAPMTAVLCRLDGASGKAEAERVLERLASRIVTRLAGPDFAMSAAVVEALADRVARAVSRRLSPSAGLIAENMDVSKAMQEVDEETGG